MERYESEGPIRKRPSQSRWVNFRVVTIEVDRFKMYFQVTSVELSDELERAELRDVGECDALSP